MKLWVVLALLVGEAILFGLVMLLTLALISGGN